MENRLKCNLRVSYYFLSTKNFIHSFILNMYIAPLQENYSEALPTPARSNKAVLRWEKNAGEVVLLLGWCWHAEAPPIESNQMVSNNSVRQ